MTVTHPKQAKFIGQVNVHGDKLERAAAIIALADQITHTDATDDDIADVLKHLKAEASPVTIAAVRVILQKGKK